jgi:PAS domain S-box-containing protein
MRPSADHNRSKQDLIAEIEELRAQVAALQSRLSGADSAAAAAPRIDTPRADAGSPCARARSADQGQVSLAPDSTGPTSAEQALPEREALLWAMSENTPDPLFIKDRAGRVIMANAATMRAIGRPAEHILGHTDEEFYDDPAVAQVMMANDRRVMESGQAEAMEESVPGPEGVRTFLSIKTPWRNAEGRVIGVIGSARDITEYKRAEKALRESEERWRTIVQNEPECIKLLDTQGRVLEMNPAGLFMLQATLDMVKGEQVSRLVVQEDRARFDEAVAAVARGETRHLVFDAIGLQGRRLTLESTCVPMWDPVESRRVQAVLCVTRDITERRRAEQALRLTQFSVDRAADAVFWMDPKGRFVYVNDRACESLGYSCEELLRMSVFDIDPVYTREFWQRDWQELRRRGSVLLESRHRRKSGEVFPIEVSARYVRYDDREYDFAFVRDITERKRYELQLARAKAEAEAASAAKDKFLAALSHELRTPLTPVLMLSQMLEEDPKLPQAAREDMKTIRQNVQLEARLIDDLLDLTRIIQGKIPLKLENVDAHQVLRHAMQTCRDAHFAQKRLKVDWQLTAASNVVSADPARLEQVFWNLINNAIKFTPPSGTITVRSSNPDPKQISIQVIDTGTGIGPDKLNVIFNPFEQGGMETTRQFGGMGLGLAIAKAVVEMHGGQIGAASEGPGKGATFTVLLATATLQESADSTAPPVPAADGKPQCVRPFRILLVEDHQPTSFVLQRLMKGWGWETTPAALVSSALELASRQPFDLVISDLGLPDGSGHDLMRYLNERYGLRGIALSGYGTEADIQKSVASGFILHLVKPVNFDELRVAVTDLLTARDGEASTLPISNAAAVGE